MTFDPLHGHTALRHGRWSDARAEFFLTICTEGRKTGLSEPQLIKAIWSEAELLVPEAAWSFRTGVVMPDHLHLLVRIGSDAGLSGTVRLFKGRLTKVMRVVGLKWQAAYFDHRMRPDEDRLPVFRYIFLNPYRAKLIVPSEKWPGYFCCTEDWVWFSRLTNNECAFPEWLG